jgi:hypothetical protein
MTVFCSKNKNSIRNPRSGGGLRKAFLFFLQVPTLFLKLAFSEGAANMFF